VAHEVVRFADQFSFGEAADVEEVLVDVGHAPLEVGLGDDQGGIGELDLCIGDRQVGTHGNTPWLSLLIGAVPSAPTFKV
jgi:hypothetical protein